MSEVKKQKKKQWKNEKEIPDIRWREGNKKLGHFMCEDHDAWSYLEPCCVCTITCKKIDKGPGVGDVNGTRVVADCLTHLHKQLLHSINKQPAPSNPEPLQDMLALYTYPTLSVRVLCNLKPSYGQTFQNFCKRLSS